MANRALPIANPATLRVGRDNLLGLTEALMEPLILAVSLWGAAWHYLGELPAAYLIVSLIAFSVSFPGPSRLRLTVLGAFWHIVLSLGLVFFLLLALGWATQFLRHFDADVIFAWVAAALLASVAAHLLLRFFSPALLSLQTPPRRSVIVGMNAQGLELARRVAADRYSHIEVQGFFDDRAEFRLDATAKTDLLGKLDQLPEYAKAQRVQQIFIAMPMSSQQRILNLLNTLRDTTASVYFVPDIFITDLIQARLESVCGMPVVAVCDTPFDGLNGLVKRGSDVVLALLILALIMPLLAVIALAVKFSSPGPVIFKQRRYGQDGAEIIVYKFRSMTVCEDGGAIRQAQKNDQRVTKVGAFLRRTSLDELPQFINVLQGRMSIVGPRPHAIAHNEMYRKVIDGYMIRHKVKPGITGWAQVCGYRGETETLDKMQARIDHDLEYLRNWSLRLDLYIILRTVWVVFKDRHAY